MVRHYRTTTQHANGASITASNLTLTVGTLLAGEGLSGAPASYTVRVCKPDGTNAEEMDVTDVSLYPQVTVTRGVNHTTAVAHDTTEIITQVVGENDLNNFLQVGSASGNMNWRGAWSTSTTYATNDVVTYLSTEYVCISGIAGSASNSMPAADPIHWQLAGGLSPLYVGAYNYEVNAAILYQIGVGFSSDGRSFSRTLEPVITTAASTWKSYGLRAPCIVVDPDGVLWMFFNGSSDGTVWKLGLARSWDNGETWTEYSGNPILSASQAWETGGGNSGNIHPTVLYDTTETDGSKRWKLWYGGGFDGSAGIGYAYSGDGITFTKYTSNPVLAPTGSTFDAGGTIATAIAKRDGTYYLFYGGRNAGNTVDDVGLATCTTPTGTYTKSANNPLLTGDGITSNLSSSVGVGDQVVSVANAALFPIGCPVWVASTTGPTQYLSYVKSQVAGSTTQLTLTDPAPVAVSSTGGLVRSAAYNSVNAMSVWYDGGWQFAITVFQAGTPAGLRELVVLGYANDDLTSISLDYQAGLMIRPSLADTQTADTSYENLRVADLRQNAARRLPPLAREIIGTDFNAVGLAPFTQGRYWGSLSAAPASGTWEVGDWGTDYTNTTIWLCATGGTPGTWVQLVGASTGAKELGYAELTSNYTTSGTSVQTIGCNVTATIGSRPVSVEAYLPSFQNSSASIQRVYFHIYDSTGSTIYAQIGYDVPGSTSQIGLYLKTQKLSPAAGSRTYQVRVQPAVGSNTLFCTATDPAWIRVQEIQT